MGFISDQSEVRLPAATKRQTLEAEAGEKSKHVFIQMLTELGEWETAHFKSHLFCKIQTKSRQNPDKIQLSLVGPKQKIVPRVPDPF